MSIQLLGIYGHPFAPPLVDIPAGQSYALVTLSPLDHGVAEATKTATFSIQPSPFYSTASLNSISINVNDGAVVAATADAYVRNGSYAGTNYGSSPSLVVKTGSTGFTRYTYLTFDLSSVSTINSAQLEMFGSLTGPQSGGVETDVYAVTDTSWNQSAITYNNAPAAAPVPLASATIAGTTQAEYTWNLTAYLQAQKAAGHNIVSLVLKDPVSSNAAVLFNSSAAGSTGPQLIID
jgi:hypothetical protein